MHTIQNIDQAAALLEARGIHNTRPRRLIAHLLLSQHQHITARALYELVRETDGEISRATVYNTLELFREHGLVQELSLEDGHRIYDTNPAPHHHLYHEDTGQIEDLDHSRITVRVPEEVLGDATLAGIDVTVRVRGETPVAPEDRGA